jgi:hypothetical protein
VLAAPLPAAPSCRRADGCTALKSLPNRIGELKKLKNLCVAARSVHFALVDRAVRQCGAGSSTGATLRSSPIRSATSQSRACTRGFRRPLSSESNQASCPPCRDVSNNALQALPMCVCNMSSLMLLYAPPEIWRRVWPRRASAAAAGTRSATSCRRCRTSPAADRAARRRCFTCASTALYCGSALLVCRVGFGSRQARQPQRTQSSARTSAHVAAAVRPPPPPLSLATPLCECRAQGG